jgi:hypothetical protein
VVTNFYIDHKVQGQQRRIKIYAKLKKCVLHVQAKATSDLVEVTMNKVEILEDQVDLQLFTMLRELVSTLETHEYLLLRRREELERLWCWMGALHTLCNAAIVDTINIATAPSALHPQVESIVPLHASKSIKNNQIVKTMHAFDVSCNTHQT